MSSWCILISVIILCLTSERLLVAERSMYLIFHVYATWTDLNDGKHKAPTVERRHPRIRLSEHKAAVIRKALGAEICRVISTAEIADAGSLQTTWLFCESRWLSLTAAVLPCSKRTSVECLCLPTSDHSWWWCEPKSIWLTSRRKIVPGCQICM